MVDFPSGLPALAGRTDYIASDSPLKWFQAGGQDQLADNQRNLLKEVGGFAAQGDMQGATRAAFAGGDLKTGIDLTNWDRQKQASDEARKFKAFEFAQKGAYSADTPEKWAVYHGVMTKLFGNQITAPYSDYTTRGALLDKFEIQKHQAEKQKADAATLNAQSAHMLAVPHAQKYEEEARSLKAQDQMAREMMQRFGFIGPSAAPPPAGSAPQPAPVGGPPPASVMPPWAVPRSNLGGRDLIPMEAPSGFAIDSTYAPPAPTFDGATLPRWATETATQPPAAAPSPLAQLPGTMIEDRPAPLPTRSLGQQPTTATASTAPQRSREPRDIIARMSPSGQLAVMGAMMKKDFAGAAKLIHEAENDFGPYKDAKQKTDVEEGLRKEVATAAKSFVDVRDAYRRVEIVAQNPSPAGDLSLIFNYMKMLDPGSTVREGEFATAQNTTGLPDRVVNTYNQLIQGIRLNPEQRLDFASQARRLYSTQHQQHASIMRQYTGIAERLGVDPRNVILDLGSESSVEAPPLMDRIKTMTLYDLKQLPPAELSEAELEAVIARRDKLSNRPTQQSRTKQ